MSGRCKFLCLFQRAQTGF